MLNDIKKQRLNKKEYDENFDEIPMKMWMELYQAETIWKLTDKMTSITFLQSEWGTYSPIH